MSLPWNALPMAGASIGAAFLFGLASSIHCLAMCGGFFLAAASKARRFATAYNSGRIIAYTGAGAAVGTLGAFLSVSDALRGAIALVGGIAVAAVGLGSLGILKPKLRLFEGLKKGIAARIIREGESAKGRIAAAFLVGLATVLMPCAPLQAMLLAALGAGSALGGASAMLAFAAGTAPALAAGNLLASAIAGKPGASVLARRLSGALVLGLGILMAGRGFVVSGLPSRIARALSFDAHLASSLPADASVARDEGGAQRVETKIGEMSFHPIVVKRGEQVLWTIEAAEENLNEHSSTLTIPDLGIRRRLAPGRNEVEFMAPDASGEMDYCSWCGMIRSKIYVVDDTASFERSSPPPEPAAGNIERKESDEKHG